MLSLVKKMEMRATTSILAKICLLRENEFENLMHAASLEVTYLLESGRMCLGHVPLVYAVAIFDAVERKAHKSHQADLVAFSSPLQEFWTRAASRQVDVPSL